MKYNADGLRNVNNHRYSEREHLLSDLIQAVYIEPKTRNFQHFLRKSA